MDRIIVPTKFNRTGKRVLRLPLDEKRVCAPADRVYWRAHRAAHEEESRKWDLANKAYNESIESIGHLIAQFVADNSTPSDERYRIVKFLVLAETSFKDVIPMSIGLVGDSSLQWWSQLQGIPEVARIIEEAWEAKRQAHRAAEEEKDQTLEKAWEDRQRMTHALWDEIKRQMMSK